MYLHLVPRILHHMKNKCTLVSVSVPELSLELKADSLVAMKPYPNKSYHVVMLKGRRALNGFLVKSPRTLTEFTMITIWEIEGFGKISHTVKTLVGIRGTNRGQDYRRWCLRPTAPKSMRTGCRGNMIFSPHYFQGKTC